MPKMGMAAGISYCETGAQYKSVPVICLHGIGGDHSSFASQIDHFGARRVIAWNMPGYGTSTPLAMMDFAAVSHSVIRLMDALAVEQAHLVGHSIGGMIALETAIRAPSRVTSLGLIATTSAFGGRDESFKTAFLEARLAPLDAGADMARVAHDTIPTILGPGASTAMKMAAITAMAGIDEAAYRQVLACLVTFNRRDDLAQLALPCCLIAGAHDTNSPAQTMEKMAQRLGDATFHVVDQAGHLVNSEAPEIVNTMLAHLFERAERLNHG